MANKQGYINPLQFTEALQQLTLLADPSRNVHISPQHLNNFTSSSSNNAQRAAQTQTRQRDREIHTSKKTRRKPRYRKSKDKNEVEDSNSKQSLSSDSSISVSPSKNKIIASNISVIRNNESNFSPSTSKSSDYSGLNMLKDSLTFSIKAISNKNSVFIRKRSVKEKFINLRSFRNPLASTYMFISKSRENIKLANHENRDKATSRKYSKKESRRERKKKEQQKEDNQFANYITEEQVKIGLSNGTLVSGSIRINPKNSRESYVSNQDSSIADYCVTSITDRNRALEGDEVILEVKPEKEWTPESKTAKVVYITQKVHSRQTVGILRPDEKGGGHALFFPRDKRFPVMRINELYLPEGFKDKPKYFENILFLAQLMDWTAPLCSNGIIIEKIGQSGNLKVELLSLLKDNQLDISPFTDSQKECLPDLKKIPEKEFEYREDIRKKCIFTIDPATARDLDDAVSVEILPNGNYEVGVHISDASFYLEEGTELDQIVSKKATTIYLVDSVYHMVPEEMCMGCSLLPGDDKLSFSVFWEMTQNAEILNQRITRTIMNSCAKLSYEHAQMIIENPTKIFTTEDFPQIYNGFEPKDIVNTVNILQSIAIILRDNRIKNGALKIDNVKLLFSLNPVTGEPVEYFVHENKEANRLIEEFMLLANISVAKQIEGDFPEIAFLRCHSKPKEHMLHLLKNKLATYGIHLNTSSSGDIADSLKKYVTDDYEGQCRAIALNHLTSKPMVRAEYFCAGSKENKSEFKHYALSVPIYTHFTSPIRRYADIMVHRLLAASLKYRDAPEWDSDYVEAIAKNCNDQKYNAKKAGDSSMELYLAHYVEQNQPFKQECVVVDVKEKKFDVIVLHTGSVVRIYPNSCERGTRWQYTLNKLTITFPKKKNLETISMTVDLFTSVKVNLRRKDMYHLEGFLERPKPPKVFTNKKYVQNN